MSSNEVVIEHSHGYHTSSISLDNNNDDNKNLINVKNEYDLYVPKWVNYEKLLPVVIIVHGFQLNRHYHTGMLIYLFIHGFHSFPIHIFMFYIH